MNEQLRDNWTLYLTTRLAAKTMPSRNNRHNQRGPERRVIRGSFSLSAEGFGTAVGSIADASVAVLEFVLALGLGVLAGWAILGILLWALVP
jgi:hypothetical protein